ncbi:L-threonylcarbamoyladenylate synthase [Blattabacterium cuenoti]|uniref:L-threonylcarbamoyladenylate synthase n=1 Tax=Blattabacterium cuenoti TaxID=1653831 RepID=UPI00163BC320|nr:L-threonylcarbamoyladenylate synthase [Blattabacterium cuenoti]
MFLKKEIDNSVSFLKKGKSLLYPTDTVWGLGCDAFNEDAVKKIYEIKNRNYSKSMILLVESMNRLSELVGKIPDFTKKIIYENFVRNKKPITIVYEVQKNIKYDFLVEKPKRTLAVRLTHDFFCTCLIKNLNRPIISTSANLSGFDSPESFYDINPYILGKIDYSVNIRRKERAFYKNSMILKILSDKIKIIRK